VFTPIPRGPLGSARYCLPAPRWVVSSLLTAASTSCRAPKPRIIGVLDQRYTSVHHEMRSLFDTVGIAVRAASSTLSRWLALARKRPTVAKQLTPHGYKGADEGLCLLDPQEIRRWHAKCAGFEFATRRHRRATMTDPPPQRLHRPAHRTTSAASAGETIAPSRGAAVPPWAVERPLGGRDRGRGSGAPYGQ